MALRPDVSPWLKMDPSLKGRALGPSFTFSRNGMQRIARASRRSPAKRAVIDAVMSDKPNFVTKAMALSDTDRADVIAVLLETMESDPKGRAMTGVLEIAAQDEPTKLAFLARLKKIPGGQVARAFPVSPASTVGRGGVVDEVLTTWEQDSKAPKGAIKAALKKN